METKIELPNSVKEAKANKALKYFTGVPCKRGHIAPRFTSTRKCYVCSNLYCREQYKKTPSLRGRSKVWYWNNHQRALATMQLYRAQNPDVTAATSKARRRARPSWVNRKQLTSIYAKAKQLTKETGIMHEVDHIIPISNKFVSGLHVPWNLQILTRELNRAKRNKFECHMTT